MRLPIAVLLLLGLATAATAAPADPEPVIDAVRAEAPVAGTAAPLSAEEMEGASGGQGVTLHVTTQQQLTGATTGNTVTAGTLTSGDVSFGAGALDGFNGVGNFVINTGANNTLQGAINISIATTPGL